MKDEINLLPPSALELRTKTVYVSHASSFLTSVIVSLLILFLVIGCAWWINREAAITVASSLAAYKQETSNVEHQITEVNAVVGLVQEHFNRKVFWTTLIAQALQQMQTDMFVTSVTVDANKKIIQIQGTSLVRSNVVVLENKLRALPWVARLDAPLQNFASNPETSFSFTMHYKEGLP